MPNITRRQNKDGSTTYRIRIYNGEDVTGKQLYQNKTWKPPAGMRPSTAEKEAHKMAVLFENQVQSGLVAFDGSTKLGEYVQEWIENSQTEEKTKEGYRSLLKRLIPALGHIKLEKLQARHLEAFYKNLGESGINEADSHAVSDKLKEIMKAQKTNAAIIAKAVGLSSTTVQAAARREHISVSSAQKISAALGMKCADVFQIHKGERGLSNNSILHYHRLISAVLEKAKKERLVPFNVAKEHTTTPKLKKKEISLLNEDQAKRFLSLLLEEEDTRFKAAFMLLLFSGVRKGELCGLSWSDIDEKSGKIHIGKASQYLVKQGIQETSTKTSSSIRTIKMPDIVFDVLKEYRVWWNKQRLMYGKGWQGQKDRLFIQESGLPIMPATINYWLTKFLKAHDLPHVTPHSLRHTFVSLQLAAGVDIRTLQSRTGHAQASTLLNIYAHAIESAQEAASEALENILLPKAK